MVYEAKPTFAIRLLLSYSIALNFNTVLIITSLSLILCLHGKKLATNNRKNNIFNFLSTFI